MVSAEYAVSVSSYASLYSGADLGIQSRVGTF